VMAAGLVGKQVTATGAGGAAVSGIVEAVRFTPLGPVLRVGEHDLPLYSATEIRS
jgi:hypothetical protein